MDDSSTATLKVPPHSIEAEQSVLGGLMLDGQAWDTIAGIVMADDFYRQNHKIIFRCIAELAEQNKPLDIVTISEALDNIKALDNVGGLAYIANLASGTPTASNIKAYADIVVERATLRNLISAAHNIAESAFNTNGRSSAELIDQAESCVFKIGDDRPSQGAPQYINNVLTKTVERIDTMYHAKGALTGLSTGFSDLDKITQGLQKSDLVIVAGRPSMGKTTFAMNIAENAVIQADVPVLVFSMEMPADSLVMRMLSSLGRINQTRIRSGQLEDEDWPRFTAAVNLLNNRPLLIDDAPALSPTELRARTRRVVREYGALGLIVIDYLQLMQVPGSSENRTAEISEISRGLKGLAKEFNCPVIAVSQLNRGLEQRSDKRPIMSDLRDSGAIEQDADIIMAIYRDEVYHQNAERGVAEIIILKQRNGPIGRKKLAFIGEFTKFEDMPPGYKDYDDSYQ